MLKSRGEFSSSEQFRDKFLETLTPGIIPREKFIDWRQIDKKFDKYKPAFEFYRSLSPCRTDEEFEDELSLGLLSSDNPHFLVETGFQLLGHTGGVYVSNQDYLKLASLEKKIDSNDEEDIELINQFVAIFSDLGLRYVVQNLGPIENYFTGVQVGLESHRRKNVGGEAFRQVVKSDLEEILMALKKDGYECILNEEDKILYSDGLTSKRVDFSIKMKDKTVGIEVNFYTASGSKPSEIKRSYGQVNSELEKVNVELVWVTDGAGYFDMKNSLKEAKDIHVNIYNLRMLKDNFKADLLGYLKLGISKV